MRFTACLVGGAVALGLAGCGGGGGSGSGAASCTPGPAASIRITATGLSPTNVCVEPNGVVTFTNGDTVTHDIQFDTPATCPTPPGPIPAAGTVQVTFPTQVNCSFHDSSNAAAFSGTVAVTTVTVTGGGY